METYTKLVQQETLKGAITTEKPHTPFSVMDNTYIDQASLNSRLSSQ